jgi:hypothetical protein
LFLFILIHAVSFDFSVMGGAGTQPMLLNNIGCTINISVHGSGQWKYMPTWFQPVRHE